MSHALMSEFIDIGRAGRKRKTEKRKQEEKDMAVGRSVWEVVKGIFIAVGKLLYLTGKLVLCLFLLVLQLVLAVFHAGSRE